MKIINISDNFYPKKLLNIKNPPKKLYIEGNINILNNSSLAIVGSRNCTPYGKKFTQIFSKEISNYNICIVSGLALGIDTIAHQNSKESLGKTIAVIGSGLNNIYPEENIMLAKEIVQNGGCIVSEYELNSKVIMSNFPKRNRIICGLSDAVLVIEATYRSGSTITANLAFKENKKVFCLPRDLEISNGIGSNQLLKKGATLVTSPKDILKEFKIDINKINTVKKYINIKDEYKSIYKLIKYLPINKEELIQKSNLSIIELNTKLTIMEMEGYIKSLAGNNYVRL